MDKCEICLHKPKTKRIPLETHHYKATERYRC